MKISKAIYKKRKAVITHGLSVFVWNKFYLKVLDHWGVWSPVGQVYSHWGVWSPVGFTEIYASVVGITDTTLLSYFPLWKFTVPSMRA